jgi:hypothetical protein
MSELDVGDNIGSTSESTSEVDVGYRGWISETYIEGLHRGSMSEIYAGDLCRRSTSEIYAEDLCRRSMPRVDIGDLRRRPMSKDYVGDLRRRSVRRSNSEGNKVARVCSEGNIGRTSKVEPRRSKVIMKS